MKVVQQMADRLYSVGMLTDLQMLWLKQKDFITLDDPEPVRKPPCDCPSCMEEWLEKQAEDKRKAKKKQLVKPKAVLALSEHDPIEDVVLPLLRRDNEFRSEADESRWNRRHNRKTKWVGSNRRKKQVTKLRHKRRLVS